MSFDLVAINHELPTAPGARRRSLDLETESFVRALPIRWRLFLLAALNGAVAVILVLLSHAGFAFAEGGYVGVDVFFVLSGFLITSLLVKEVFETGRISIAGFYARRARRILPAASAVAIAAEPRISPNAIITIWSASPMKVRPIAVNKAMIAYLTIVWA